MKSELEYQDIQLKELATMTGISKNTLGNYLTGHNSIPNAETAVKIAHALGVSVEYLITGKSTRSIEKMLPPKIRALVALLVKLDSTDINSLHALVAAMIERYDSGQKKKPQ